MRPVLLASGLLDLSLAALIEFLCELASLLEILAVKLYSGLNHLRPIGLVSLAGSLLLYEIIEVLW